MPSRVGEPYPPSDTMRIERLQSQYHPGTRVIFLLMIKPLSPKNCCGSSGRGADYLGPRGHRRGGAARLSFTTKLWVFPSRPHDSMSKTAWSNFPTETGRCEGRPSVPEPVKEIARQSRRPIKPREQTRHITATQHDQNYPKIIHAGKGPPTQDSARCRSWKMALLPPAAIDQSRTIKI
jgi:hypothetical protein